MNQNEFETVDEAYNEVVKLRTALANLVDTINAHEIESLQCDGKDEEYCDCLRKSAKKAGLILPNVKAEPMPAASKSISQLP